MTDIIIDHWYTKRTPRGYLTERKVIEVRHDAMYGYVVFYRELVYGNPQYARERSSTLTAWKRWAKDATVSRKRGNT